MGRRHCGQCGFVAAVTVVVRWIVEAVRGPTKTRGNAAAPTGIYEAAEKISQGPLGQQEATLVLYIGSERA